VLGVAGRFWAKVSKSDTCWNWTAATVRGYGVFQLGTRRLVRAHRLAWEMAYGPIPDALLVCHHCDNPLCVKTEPDEQWPEGHLFLGTHSDNMVDSAQKGRHRESRKTHCPRGHSLSGNNLYRSPSVRGRVCRRCVVARVARYRNQQVVSLGSI
jgi:hypothetical protein